MPCFGSKYLQETKERLLNVKASGEAETQSTNWNREFETFINPLRPEKNSTYTLHDIYYLRIFVTWMYFRIFVANN